MSANTDISQRKGRRRGPGKPWKKGESGNPSGRPAMPEEVKAMLERFSPEAVQFQYDTMNNEDAPLGLRVKCSELLADRGLGRPIQAVDLKGDSATIIVLSHGVEGVL